MIFCLSTQRSLDGYHMKNRDKFHKIVWFRNDLRIHDNPALFRAAEDGEGILAVYLICREMVENHVVAPVRLDFIRRHLLQLNHDLAAINIPLLVINLETTAEIIPYFQQMIS